MGQDFRLVAADVALDGLVGLQIGEVALGHHQRIVVIRQVGAVLDSASWYFSCTWLISFSSFSICSMGAVFFSRSAGFKSVRCSGGVALSRASARATVMAHLGGALASSGPEWNLAGGLHVAQDACHVWDDLLVLQQLDCLGADTFELVAQLGNSAIDGARGTTLNVRAKRSLLTPRSMARRIM